MLGGGIHKAGVIAAAGLVALRDMPSQLCEDHRRARQLSKLLAEMPLLRLAHPVQTSIIDLAFDSSQLDGQRFVACTAASGLGVAGPWNDPWGGWIRLVTHYGIDDADVEHARDILSIACRQALRYEGRQQQG